MEWRHIPEKPAQPYYTSLMVLARAHGPDARVTLSSDLPERATNLTAPHTLMII